MDVAVGASQTNLIHYHIYCVNYGAESATSRILALRIYINSEKITYIKLQDGVDTVTFICKRFLFRTGRNKLLYLSIHVIYWGKNHFTANSHVIKRDTCGLCGFSYSNV